MIISAIGRESVSRAYESPYRGLRCSYVESGRASDGAGMVSERPERPFFGGE